MLVAHEFTITTISVTHVLVVIVIGIPTYWPGDEGLQERHLYGGAQDPGQLHFHVHLFAATWSPLFSLQL